MKFNLDYDIRNSGLGYSSLRDLGLGNFNLEDFTLADFDLIPIDKFD